MSETQDQRHGLIWERVEPGHYFGREIPNGPEYHVIRADHPEAIRRMPHSPSPSDVWRMISPDGYGHTYPTMRKGIAAANEHYAATVEDQDQGEPCDAYDTDNHRFHDPAQGHKRFLCCAKCGHMEPWTGADVMTRHNRAGDGCHHFDQDTESVPKPAPAADMVSAITRKVLHERKSDEPARCERCNTRVPDGGSLVLYRSRWSCDACRDEDKRRHDYQRGWDASVRYGRNGNPGKRSALEAADTRGEPAAWYQGYEDHACDREKWASLTSADPTTCVPGFTCGEHPSDTHCGRPLATANEDTSADDLLRSLMSETDRRAYDLGVSEAGSHPGVTSAMAFAYFCDAVRELGPNSEEAPNRHALYWHGVGDTLRKREEESVANRPPMAWRELPGLALSPKHPAEGINLPDDPEDDLTTSERRTWEQLNRHADQSERAGNAGWVRAHAIGDSLSLATLYRLGMTQLTVLDGMRFYRPDRAPGAWTDLDKSGGRIAKALADAHYDRCVTGPYDCHTTYGGDNTRLVCCFRCGTKTLSPAGTRAQQGSHYVAPLAATGCEHRIA